MNERLPHHELQLLLGAYVLGGLDSADRRRLEDHLPRCEPCTVELSRFAAVPGLLQLAPPADTGAWPATPPQDSLPKLITAARASRVARRRRRWVLAAAAVVVALSVVSGTVLAIGRDAGPAPAAVVSTTATDDSGQPRVVGQVMLDPRGWGTEVHLELSYVPHGAQPYTAWAVDKYGHEEQAAAWSTPEGGRCSVTGATSIQRTELDRIEVRSADGETLLRSR
jgi:hypothetical protein